MSNSAFRRVTHSSLESVLKSTAYMLFYVKKHLDYKPYSRPSYVLTRETEAVREREKERASIVVGRGSGIWLALDSLGTEGDDKLGRLSARGSLAIMIKHKI